MYSRKAILQTAIRDQLEKKIAEVAALQQQVDDLAVEFTKLTNQNIFDDDVQFEATRIQKKFNQKVFEFTDKYERIKLICKFLVVLN